MATCNISVLECYVLSPKTIFMRFTCHHKDKLQRCNKIEKQHAPVDSVFMRARVFVCVRVCSRVCLCGHWPRSVHAWEGPQSLKRCRSWAKQREQTCRGSSLFCPRPRVQVHTAGESVSLCLFHVKMPEYVHAPHVNSTRLCACACPAAKSFYFYFFAHLAATLFGPVGLGRQQAPARLVWIMC